jgi:hypothetical protein
MKNLYVAMFTLLVVNSALAQINKSNIEKIFDEETIDEKYTKREHHSGKYLYVPTQTVPGWFVNPPAAEGNSVFAIGISDPEPDTVKALNSAIYRALVIANVLHKNTTQLLCDFYVNDDNKYQDVVYEHFSRINAKLPLDADYTVVSKYRNKYDETMVLVKYNPPKRIKHNEFYRIRIELYRNEIESSASGSFESVYEMQVLSDAVTKYVPVFYQLTELGNHSAVVSGMDTVPADVPIYSLKYSGIPVNDSTVKVCSFSHGLWKEYFKSITVFIIAKSREKPENISYLDETYQYNNTQKLTRGISSNRMQFVISKIYGNKIGLNVKLKEVKK